MRTAVITPVSGRRDHLENQLAALDRSQVRPDVHIVVAMNDPTVADRIVERRSIHLEQITVPGARLPVATARNRGADTAISLGADLLIFLDVDCLPTTTMVTRYVEAAERHPASALFCGPVTYLPPPPGPQGYRLDQLETLVSPHPARPDPEPDELVESHDHALFWSLSFAVRSTTWRDLGGFHTAYAGYGAEDTDFGQQAARHGIPLCWVGGAHALHQYHPVSDPPVEHLDDILINASVFHDRWGWWPMQGWLDDFERLGLIRMRAGAPERNPEP